MSLFLFLLAFCCWAGIKYMKVYCKISYPEVLMHFLYLNAGPIPIPPWRCRIFETAVPFSLHHWVFGIPGNYWFLKFFFGECITNRILMQLGFFPLLLSLPNIHLKMCVKIEQQCLKYSFVYNGFSNKFVFCWPSSAIRSFQSCFA